MIAVDTSAIMSVLLGEETSASVKTCLAENDLCMSAGTYSELLIVATGRDLLDEARELISGMRFEIVPLDGVAAHAAQNAFANWGKRRHPASLNFGDCFGYALAKQRDIPLLFVGNDFSKTDLEAALEMEPSNSNNGIE